MEWANPLTVAHVSRILAAVALFGVAAAAAAGVMRRRSREVHKRGVVLDERPPWRRMPRLARPRPEALSIAGTVLPLLDETKHFKIIGTTGTGKSTAIRQLLGGALARGDRAIIADPDGGYRERFFRRYRGDVVLNPFEPHSVQWDPFSEINDDYDADQLSAALIASTNDASSNEWRSYARTFLTAVLRSCDRSGRRGVDELWNLLAVAPSEELRSVVRDTPAQPFLDPDNARMFGSIRSVAVSAAAALEYIQRQRCAPFSVRGWVRNHREPGALFITYKAAQIAALRSMIATWMSSG